MCDSDLFPFSCLVPPGDEWDNYANQLHQAFHHRPGSGFRYIANPRFGNPKPSKQSGYWCQLNALHLPLPQPAIDYTPVVAFLRVSSDSTHRDKFDQECTRMQSTARYLVTALARHQPAWKLVAVMVVRADVNSGIHPWMTCTIEFLHDATNNACP